MLNKKLIIEPGGGLGNRILALSSAFNLAKELGIEEILLLWRNNNECGCEYEDVFTGMPLPCKVKTIHFGKESYKELLSKGRVFSAIRKSVHLALYNQFRKNVRRIQLDTGENRNSESDWNKLKKAAIESKDDKMYIEAYYQFYGDNNCDGMTFNQEVVEKVNAYKAKLGKYVAMHIRRTDNVVAIQNSPTELFYEKIEELLNEDSNLKIYIATDDAGILEDLRNKYPSNIVSEASGAVSRRTSEGIKFALYEMLILAGAETIYASFGSTFTKIANIIGKNEMITLQK